MTNAFWGSYERTIARWFEKAEKQDVVRRIWSKDTALWTSDPAGRKEALARLGWLAAPALMKEKVAELESFADEIKNAGFTKAVLLGMGGSSLAPEVFQRVCGSKKGNPDLFVLDSTDPERVKDIEAALDPAKTLFIVSSKSGGTIELVSFFKYFFDRMKNLNGEKAGSQFVAITDPGSPLEDLAKKNGFRKIFLAPEDVGGRFSALTYFGLVPAAIIGVDIGQILKSASALAEAASADFDIEDNPAVPLGIGMAVLAEEGRDKLTILSSVGLESFADWAEQLVAESSGKEGFGIVPITHELIGRPGQYGQDRFFVALVSDADAGLEKKLEALRSAGHPVLSLTMKGSYDLGAELFRWEFATALTCALLKVNAFDQPDVQSAKERTRTLLKKIERGEKIQAPQTQTDLEVFWSGLNNGDYIGILAFLPDRSQIKKELQNLQLGLRELTGKAVTLGWGPRYLHSTGQLHKGGPSSGAFIMITAKHASDLPIPGEKYGFRELEQAQALGDLEALVAGGRRVVHFELENVSAEALQRLSVTLAASLRSTD